MALLTANATGTLSANGSTANFVFPGGDLYISASGTFGSGTITPFISYDDGVTFVPETPAALTSSGSVRMALPDCLVKLTLSGATSPSIVFALSRRKPV